MVLKIRSIAFILFQIMLFSGSAYCEDNVRPDPQAITYDIIKAFESGSSLMSKGMPGEIISDPVQNQKDGYIWYKVRYDDGTEGWSFENGLDPAPDNSKPKSVTESSSNKFNKGDRIEANRDLYVRSDSAKASDPVIPNAYAAYQTWDKAAIVSYGRIQFIAKGGTDSPLYRLLESYTELSNTPTSTDLKKYVTGARDGSKPWGESLRTDDTFHDLLMKAASEDAMKKAQDKLFKEDYYDKAKKAATDDGVTSALGIAIYCDTAVQGGLSTLRTRTNEYFKSLSKTEPTRKPATEQEWLGIFLNLREERLTNLGWSADRVEVLRKLVDNGNLDLKQGDSKNKIDLGQFGKIDTIDAPGRIWQAAAAAIVLGLGLPGLSPTSDSSGFSGPNVEETNVPETTGVSYFDQANDVWYIDAFSWSGDRSQYDKPAAPRRFVSGELNTVGYNWVSLPFSRTGLWYDQGYFDWCAETLASMGQSAPSAGYGLLVGEDSEF